MKRYFEESRKFAPLLTKEDLYKSMTVSPGGYGVNWGEGLEISDEELQKLGVDVPLSLNDFLCFVKERVISSAETAELLTAKSG